MLPLFLALLLTAVGVRTYLQSPLSVPSLPVAAPIIIYIQPKSSVQDIARTLREAGVIQNTWTLLALAYVQGSIKRLQSGEYEFSSSMSLREILRKLETGRVVTHQMTIPEGFTAQEIAKLLASEHLVDSDRFGALVRDPSFAARVGVKARGLEGYLFPDTYRLTRGMTEEEILRLMVGRFQQAIPRDFLQEAAHLGMSPHAVVTLASLIEKEARLDSERALVSAVFHNRLRQRMPLQSDPTAVYMVPRTQHRITAEDLQRKTPYNTYLFPGLPPGPIANPGLASLEAALHPAPVNVLYFVAKNDGSHFFSRTLEQHQRAVRQYQGGGGGHESGRGPSPIRPRAAAAG
jgi:UPF0755 protein